MKLFGYLVNCIKNQLFSNSVDQFGKCASTNAIKNTHTHNKYRQSSLKLSSKCEKCHVARTTESDELNRHLCVK